MPRDIADFAGIDSQNCELIEIEPRGYRAAQPIDSGGFIYPSNILQVFFEIEGTATGAVRDTRHPDVATGVIEHLVPGAALQRRREAGGEHP